MNVFEKKKKKQKKKYTVPLCFVYQFNSFDKDQSGRLVSSDLQFL